MKECNDLYISVAFITMGGIAPLLGTLKDLEKKKIKGRNIAAASDRLIMHRICGVFFPDVIRLECRDCLENETVWLTQAQMAMLFDKDQSVIARHIKNAISEGEIEESNMQILHNTLSKYKPTTVYNLDVIISVGYRVHSQRGVQFRRWANSVLKDYLIKGYAVKNNMAQQKYEDLKSLVDVMGRTMGYLDSPDSDHIADNALVALTLMIAESKTDEMDMMVKVVVNLINGENV